MEFRRIVPFASLSIVLGLCASAVAKPPPSPLPPNADNVAVPEPLRPWMGWVLHDGEEALCTPLDGHEDGDPACSWPARLQLTVDDKGGRFTQQWRVRGKKIGVSLPGDEKRWPQEVRVDGKPAVVLDDDGDPTVQLAPGDHTVTGAFRWDEAPESLPVPPETGLLALVVRGKKVDHPIRDADGQLWLEKEAAAEEEADVLEVAVHRLVDDTIPLKLVTSLELRVSGRSREVTLGRALPPGFVPMSLETPLPARLEPDSRLRVQVRPGTWTITLTARHDGPVALLERPTPDGPWKEGDEVWVWQAHPELRVVQIEGVPSIDPQQTTLPDAWKRLPTYAVKLGDTVKLVEQRRGDAEPAPDRLTLRRSLWLDFDGKGWTVQDEIAGTLHRAWRLEVQPEVQLGRVAVGGKDQFITVGDGGRTGVEIRQGSVSASADSRLDGGGDLPAVGWDADFHEVAGTLHMPPGWRLLHAAGADDVPTTWIRAWSLLDLFLALVIAMAIFQLYGFGWGALALIALALLFPEEDAPRWTWLALLATEALVRLLPAGRFSTAMRFLRLGLRVGLALLAIGFAVGHVRTAIYPALGGPLGSIDLEEQTRSSHFMMLAKEAEAPPPPQQQAQTEEKSVFDGNSGLGGGASGSIDSLVDEKSGGRGKGEEGRMGKKGYRKLDTNLRQYVQEYDPNQVVQTGPGLPRWSWHTLPLKWTGPVERTQRLHLYLLSPSENRALALLRVILLALLVLRLIDSSPRRGPGAILRVPSVTGGLFGLLALLAAMLAFAPIARAEVPPKEMLDELRTRLTKAPECRPHCAASPRLALEITAQTLRARMEIDAAAPTGVPLPGGADQWLPAQVLLDGKTAPALLQDGGKLWIEVPEGSHQVLLEGPLPPRDVVQIALPLKSHRVEAKADGWRLEGLHEDGLADDDLQLTRVRSGADEENTAALQPGALPPFVRVVRLITLGLVWQVETTVTRLTPTGSAVVLEVPLLPGESVTTPEVRVAGGKAQVNMGATATEVSWRSLLKETSEITLSAPRSLPWTEVWLLEASPVWHVEPKGIPVVHQLDGAGLRRPEWDPWPGESVSIAISRPKGVPGQTLTIDSTSLRVTPGLRATDVTLDLSLRASRGGRHEIALPPGAVVQSLTVDGQAQPIRMEQGRLILSTTPGRQAVCVTWRQSDPVSTRYEVPLVDVGAPSVNAEVRLELAEDRWVLFAGGPRLGPAVLFWSFLLVLVFVAYGLGQVHFVPLRGYHWFLLGLGLTQVHLAAAAVVVGWILALGWRGQEPGRAWRGRWLFNLRQLLLIGWTAVALIILVTSIHDGLLGEPRMQIVGNDSYAHSLRWYQDRAFGPLPQPWVISVPLTVYRVVMLLWALWLARALLRWLRWGFGNFGRGGLWRKNEPKTPAPPKTDPPSPPKTDPPSPPSPPPPPPKADPPPPPPPSPPPPPVVEPPPPAVEPAPVVEEMVADEPPDPAPTND